MALYYNSNRNIVSYVMLCYVVLYHILRKKEKGKKMLTEAWDMATKHIFLSLLMPTSLQQRL